MTNSDRIILYLVATCLSLLLFSWGVYALAAAKAILSSVFEAGEDEDGEDGEDGEGDAEPVGPDGSGDEVDPADWWKKESGTGTKQ